MEKKIEVTVAQEKALFGHFRTAVHCRMDNGGKFDRVDLETGLILEVQGGLDVFSVVSNENGDIKGYFIGITEDQKKVTDGVIMWEDNSYSMIGDMSLDAFLTDYADCFLAW